MFCPQKNSYLQLVCAVNPRVINKAVQRAMRRRHYDPHDEKPPAQRLESMQPSLYAPCVDITRATLGYGYNGLCNLMSGMSSDDSLEKLQAIHSMLDQVQISENAMFLIKRNLVERVISLMMDSDPIVREKSLLILTHLVTYYQGRKRILARPILIERLMNMFLRDRKEIRYAAAHFLNRLTRDKCACELLMKTDTLIPNLLKTLKNEHTGIVIHHLRSIERLCEWDPAPALKANGFLIMKNLIAYYDRRIIEAALDCMTQLCKHDVSKKLADKYDMTKLLESYLLSPDMEVITAAVGLMCYTTQTTCSKWRVVDFSLDIIKRLVTLSMSHNTPTLQMRAIQVLINLCDSPDNRNEIKGIWLNKIKNMKIRNIETWDGTTETSSFGLETGLNYRKMCVEEVQAVQNIYGKDHNLINVESYLRRIHEKKDQLLKSITMKPYLNIHDIKAASIAKPEPTHSA